MRRIKNWFIKKAEYRQLLSNRRSAVTLYVLYIVFIVFVMAAFKDMKATKAALDNAALYLHNSIPDFEVSDGHFLIEDDGIQPFIFDPIIVRLNSASDNLDNLTVHTDMCDYSCGLYLNKDGYAYFTSYDGELHKRKWGGTAFDSNTVYGWVITAKNIMVIAYLLRYLVMIGIYFLSAWYVAVICQLFSGILEYYVEMKQIYRLALYGMTLPAFLYGIAGVTGLTRFDAVNIGLLLCAVVIPCIYVGRTMKQIDNDVRERGIEAWR